MAENSKKGAEDLRNLAKDTLNILKEQGEQYSQLGRVAGLVTNQAKQQTMVGQAALKVEETLYNIKKR